MSQSQGEEGRSTRTDQHSTPDKLTTNFACISALSEGASRANLYHFTILENVAAIKREGFRATHTGDSLSMIGLGPPAVFLCDTPTSAITDAELEVLLQRHPDTPPIRSQRWLRPFSEEPLARFTVRLASSDRKLKQYGPWLRANHHRIDDLPDPDDIMIQRAMRTWRFYRGDIPPSKIIDCIIEPAPVMRVAASR
ncbi:hypothetical protein [Bradyrhizobium erythrophlei]|uniref:DarT domain-containing protein n=1 Tax=Bradyrhizobium erythrophlei TaxID=1437360 RepID=A0A1M5QH06_9BRAD|nr:hypothetical protein [Bradyrhizobium erythrophlei]SHH13198.1 hypothetical protein SAMN05444169_5925 [Bradyrhizobium erythrophlei]